VGKVNAIAPSSSGGTQNGEIRSAQLIPLRQRVFMPSKDRPLVGQHAPKDSVGWLMNAQQVKVCRFANDLPTAHAEWLAPMMGIA
jgi:hypothetical protein